jgi:hypothetical protein
MVLDASRDLGTPIAPRDAAEFSFSKGPFYADKDEYIAKGLIFIIKSIERQPGAGYEGTDRWAITVTVDDGRPDEIITLQCNEKRDAELEAAAAHIRTHGPIQNAQLVKAGKAYYLRNVT